MHYAHVVQGFFIRRINRFVAEVEIGDRREMVHVKNTGRLKELLVPQAKVYLEVSDRKGRKYKHSLIAVEKGDMLVNIDSQLPNVVVHEALVAGKVQELGPVIGVKREVSYGRSRFDLYFERDGRKGFMEVKGVTLEKDGVAMFPDAPTVRGKKHLLELVQAVKEGYAGVVFFLVQMKGVQKFAPHIEMDPPFAAALKEAAEAGVEILAYDSEVSPQKIRIGDPLPVDL